jgi:hypothetical protein
VGFTLLVVGWGEAIDGNHSTMWVTALFGAYDVGAEVTACYVHRSACVGHSFYFPWAVACVDRYGRYGDLGLDSWEACLKQVKVAAKVNFSFFFL